MSRADIAIGVIGVGTIGSYWLNHFADTLALSTQTRVTGIFRSRHYLDAPRGVDLSRWSQQFEHAAVPGDAEAISAWIKRNQQRADHVILLDLTASKTVSRQYPRWFAEGAHIISANKYAGSSRWDWYQELQRVQAQYQRHWLYNTTVGAGLPILTAVDERCRCGDTIFSIEGNLSGSLSWIFQQYRSGDKLSDWLVQAQQLGLTEPDPRLDLGGMDVARKLVILAREAGWTLQLDDLKIQNLVPEALRALDVASFLQQLETFDTAFDDWRQATAPTAEQWVYLGYIRRTEEGRYEAGTCLQPIDAESNYARLPAGNANFTVRSQQYNRNPLVIQGPGAGPEVTAAGVHSDVLQLITKLKNLT
ncbi:hypothetical protein [Pseudidiomarina sediminum]|uniref:hypothetical protein n=1 Tax=Pseudidiomarina sediminum TaxID=431675 RepID=UPI001C9395BB|nr:hypothetical protein [Pseudidiomarina sediminum]MBY6064456.1 hypothetical protein [Pseudidiomarina sediminum]